MSVTNFSILKYFRVLSNLMNGHPIIKTIWSVSELIMEVFINSERIIEKSFLSINFNQLTCSSILMTPKSKTTKKFTKSNLR